MLVRELRSGSRPLLWESSNLRLARFAEAVTASALAAASARATASERVAGSNCAGSAVCREFERGFGWKGLGRKRRRFQVDDF